MTEPSSSLRRSSLIQVMFLQHYVDIYLKSSVFYGFFDKNLRISNFCGENVVQLYGFIGANDRLL